MTLSSGRPCVCAGSNTNCYLCSGTGVMPVAYRAVTPMERARKIAAEFRPNARRVAKRAAKQLQGPGHIEKRTVRCPFAAHDTLSNSDVTQQFCPGAKSVDDQHHSEHLRSKKPGQHDVRDQADDLHNDEGRNDPAGLDAERSTYH